ncbi:MAG TPA: glycosyltransferase family 4 protein [Anaerolineae bacterium]|nr:glycosyltransferase family 4 protein [Anaerolineae bacterium]
MRIALVSQEYPPETAHGGIGAQTYLKAHGLAALGHEVVVVSHSADNTQRGTWDGPVRVIRIPGYDQRLPIHTEPARWLTYSAEAAAAVSALHSAAPLDIVDFPEYGAEGFVHLLNQAEWSHIPTVVHVHGPLVMLAHTIGWPELDSELYRIGTEMERTCLRLADAVFSSSRCSADWCARHYGLDLAHVPILHTGVDIDLFRPLAAPKADRPTIVFAGRIAASKGVETLLEAALRLAAEWPDLQLRMLGRGDPHLMAKMQAQAQASAWPDLLDLAGFVPRAALPAQLNRAHVFAAPSWYEGGPGFVYLEAMACGLPVIACSGSGAAEVVQHGENGLLVAPGDVDGLVDALRHLLAEPAERAAMGQRARSYVEREADSRHCLRRMEGLYSAVAAGVTGRR